MRKQPNVIRCYCHAEFEFLGDLSDGGILYKCINCGTQSYYEPKADTHLWCKNCKFHTSCGMYGFVDAVCGEYEEIPFAVETEEDRTYWIGKKMDPRITANQCWPVIDENNLIMEWIFPEDSTEEEMRDYVYDVDMDSFRVRDPDRDIIHDDNHGFYVYEEDEN